MPPTLADLVGIQQEVLGLEVAVDVARVVHEGNGRDNLPKELPGLVLLHGSVDMAPTAPACLELVLGHDVVEQLATRSILHHNEEPLIGLNHLWRR